MEIQSLGIKNNGAAIQHLLLQIYATSALILQSVFVADIDADGDLDIAIC